MQKFASINESIQQLETGNNFLDSKNDSCGVKTHYIRRRRDQSSCLSIKALPDNATLQQVLAELKP